MRHRQTKGAATDMFDLPPPRHISTLRGVFTSVPELEAAIHDYLDHHNAHPKPFVWTKSAEEILAKVSRARRTLETVAQGNQVINSVH